jgi:hypothetical protein
MEGDSCHMMRATPVSVGQSVIIHHHQRTRPLANARSCQSALLRHAVLAWDNETCCFIYDLFRDAVTSGAIASNGEISE